MADATSALNNAFVKHYEAEVHNAYQRMGSKLRNTVRTRNNVKGCSATFFTMGSVQVIDNKEYGKPIFKPGNGREDNEEKLRPSRGSKEITLKNYYTGDWIDTLDDLRTNNDEKMILAQAGAYALGRKTDDIIIAAMTDAEGINEIAQEKAAEGLNKEKILEVFELLGANDVPDDGQRFALVGWKQWSNLLSIPEFASSDYIGDENLPWKGTQAKQWLGTLWMPHSGVEKTGTNHRECLWYHRTAIGHAIGKDITTDITWHGDHASYFVNNMMSQGAGVIDPKGIVKISVKEG